MSQSSFRRLACGLVVVAALLFEGGCASDGKKSVALLHYPNAVGRLAENSYVIPTGQLLTPAGLQVELPEMRPQALALSPDGQMLITAGRKNQLVVIDPRQRGDSAEGVPDHPKVRHRHEPVP